MSLEEVARRARVSTATVSRVLNNLDVVKSSTRARVMKAVAELNYHPNLNARSLAGGRSQTLGMIASNLANPFFFDIFRTLEADARDNGYELLAAHTGYQPEQLLRSVRTMIGRRVGGLAVVVSEMQPDLIEELERNRIRSVFYDVGPASGEVTNIRVNYRAAMERMVEYLHDLGHQRLGFIGHHSTLAPTSERERAFVETVSRFPGKSWRTVADQDSLEGGMHAARTLLTGDFRPTAILCVNDFMAIGVLRELRERGLRVPEDVSVTGFDNIQMSEFCWPALTTVDIPRDDIGHLAFHALVGEEPPSGERVIEPEVVFRGSTGPASE